MFSRFITFSATGFFAGALLIFFFIAVLFAAQYNASLPEPTAMPSATESTVAEATIESTPVIPASTDASQATSIPGAIPTDISQATPMPGNVSTEVSQATSTNSAPVDIEALMNEAFEAYDNGDFQKTADLLEPNIDKFEGEQLLYALAILGASETKLGDYPKAIEHLERACQISPTGQFYYLLADAYYENGDKEKALANYQLAIQTPDPNMPPEFKELTERRIAELQAALNIKP